MRVWMQFSMMIALGALFARAGGNETKLLPAFELADLEGQTFTSTDIVQEGPWLLIYVRPGCAPCERLLNLFKGEDLDQPNRVVILVGASTTKARALVEKYPDLMDAFWALDAQGTGFSSLKLAGAPVALGLHGAEIAWRVHGLVPNSEDLRSIVLSWLKE